MTSEKDLQQKIIELISNEDFYDAIMNKEAVNEALNSYSDETIIPHLSIDDLLKKKYSKAAKSVLKSLPACEIVTGDIIKNISLTADEKLFPDIILFNYETSQVVLIENKINGKTAREAVTEIYGYINEIRNHLPFASNYDISVIIVSPVFNTLLDHSVSSNILSSNINLLCLVPIEDKDLKFNIHFPKSWSDIGQNNLPENSMVSYSWCLKKKVADLEINNFSILNLARDLIVSTANKIASSGFVLIWENCSLKESECEFVITNYVINPFAFLPNAYKAGFEYKDTVLAIHLKEYSDDHGGLVHPSSIFEIMEEACIFLNEYFLVEIESATDWNIDYQYENNRIQRKPLLFDSWGMIGDYVRFYYFHPAVRKYYFGTERDNYLGHLHPLIGLQIINIITKNILFKNGHFHGFDLFNFGKQLACFNFVCSIAKQSNDTLKNTALLFWSILELSQSIKELEFYSQNTKGIDDKINFQIHLPLRPEDIKDNFKEDNDLFARNFNQLFLKNDNDKLQRKLFNFGYYYGLYFSDLWKPTLSVSNCIRIEEEIGSFIRAFLIALSKSVKNKERHLNRYEVLFFNSFLESNFNTIPIEKIEQKLSDISNNKLTIHFPEFLESFQVTIGLPHKELTEFIVPKSIDWNWHKESLARQFKLGHRHGCVNIEPNGNISTSQVEEEYKVMGKLKNEDEVYLKMYTDTTLYFIHKVLWKDIESGTAFTY